MTYRSTYATFNDTVDAANAGIFSVDESWYKAKRQREADAKRTIENAYLSLGMNRDEELKRIAAELEGKRFDGVWATSTIEYGERRAQLDAWVLETLRLVTLEEDGTNLG